MVFLINRAIGKSLKCQHVTKKKKKNAETELEVERHLRLNDPLALYTLQSFYLRKPHRLCNCLRARPECGISWVRVPVGSNQRLWY